MMIEESIYGLDSTKVWRSTAVCAVSTFVCFLSGSITKNCSQVDKLWSILPVIHAAIWCNSPNCSAFPTILTMFAVVFIWGVRLTTNFALRGGYTWPLWKGEEDYRWEIVRSWASMSYKDKVTGRRIMKWTWHLFNFGFISLYQNILLFSVVLPFVQLNWKYCNSSLSRSLFDDGFGTLQLIKDGVLTVFMLCFVVFEAIADHQRNVFHWDKQLGKVDGFCKSGLFAYCRHPNYLCENLFWFCLCFYTLDVSDLSSIFNWSWLGTVQYMLLFHGSINLTEDISINRYGRKFKKYQKEVPMLFPKLF